MKKKKKNSRAKKIKKVSPVKRKVKEVASAKAPPKKRKEDTLEKQLEKIPETSSRPSAKAVNIEASSLNQIERGTQETFKLEEGMGNAPVRDIKEEPTYNPPKTKATEGDYETVVKNTMEPARIVTPNINIAEAHLETSPQVRDMNFRGSNMMLPSDDSWTEDYKSARPERADPTINRPTGLQTEKKYQIGKQ